MTITSYCLSSKTCQVLSHQPLAMLAVLMVLGDLSIFLQRLFACLCEYRCGCAQKEGRWHPVYQRFLKKKEKPSPLSGFLLPCAGFSHQL